MSGSRKSILVIETDGAVRTMFSGLLRKQHYRVQTETDFKEALRRVKGTRFDCLIMDADLDGVGGTDALERLRLVDPSVKVLFLSRRPKDVPAHACDDKTYVCYVSAAGLADFHES